MKELTELLAKLAEKLGTTTQYLWGVLIKQASVEIYIFISVFVLTIIGAIITTLLLKSTQKYWDKENAPAIAWFTLTFGIIFAFATVIGLGYFLANITDVITSINNPEYWALQEVLKSIR